MFMYMYMHIYVYVCGRHLLSLAARALGNRDKRLLEEEEVGDDVGEGGDEGRVEHERRDRVRVSPRQRRELRPHHR